MTHFKNGEYGNNSYTIRPIGWRKYCVIMGWTFPYPILSKVKWRIEIKPNGANALPLREFDIYEHVPPFETKKIMSHRNISENTSNFDFLNERDLSNMGHSQYWLGEIGESNSYLLIDIDVFHGDAIFWSVIYSVIGGIIGAIFTFVLKRYTSF